MPGLRGDPVERGAGGPGRGGVPGAQRVAGDPGCGQTGLLGAGTNDPGDGVRGEGLVGHAAAAEADEKDTWCGAAVVEPLVEGGDRVGSGVVALRDPYLFAGALLVGL